jgi:hypothetical protein
MGNVDMGKSFHDSSILNDLIASEENLNQSDFKPSISTDSQKQHSPTRNVTFASRESFDTEIHSNTRSSTIIELCLPSLSPSPNPDYTTYEAYDVLNDPAKLQENIIENLRNQLLELSIEKNMQSKKLEDVECQNKKLKERMKKDKKAREADLNHWIKRCSALKVRVSKVEKQLEEAVKIEEEPCSVPEPEPEPERRQLDPDGTCAADEDSIDRIEELEVKYSNKLQQLNSHIVMLNSEVGFWKHEHGEIKMRYESLLAVGAQLENELFQSRQVVLSLQKQVEKLTRALALKEKQLQKGSKIPSVSKKNTSHVLPGPSIKLSLGDVKQASSGNNFRRMSRILNQSSARTKQQYSPIRPQQVDFDDNDNDAEYIVDYVLPTKTTTPKPIAYPSILKKTLQARTDSDRTINVDFETRAALDRSISWDDSEEITVPASTIKPLTKINHFNDRTQSDADLVPTKSQPRKSYDVRQFKNSPPKCYSIQSNSINTESTDMMSVGTDVTPSSESGDSSDSSSSSSSTSSDDSFDVKQLVSPNSTKAPEPPDKKQKPSLKTAMHDGQAPNRMKSDTELLPSILKSPSSPSKLKPKPTSRYSIALKDLEEPLKERLDQSLTSLGNESISNPDFCIISKPDLAPAKSAPRKSYNIRKFRNNSPNTSLQSIETDNIADQTEQTDSMTSETGNSSESDSLDSNESTSSGESEIQPSIEIRTQQDSTKTCLVSHMPFTEKESGSSGLYSGQIDIASKLPNGFGALKCGKSDIFSGNWKMGLFCQ